MILRRIAVSIILCSLLALGFIPAAAFAAPVKSQAAGSLQRANAQTAAMGDGYVYDSDPNFAVPYSTYTLGPEGREVLTQTAYTPLTKLALNEQSLGEKAGLKNPEDMYYDAGSDLLYIADTGNARVAVLGGDGTYKAIVGEGILSAPMGITGDGEKLYVADKAKKTVFVFSLNDYTLLSAFEKPNNPLVGANTPFVPLKVKVDKRGNIYLVSEGCVNGLMQLNSAGEFLGYVGANETPASLQSVLQRLFFSDTQQGILKTPRSPTNLAINDEGLLFTVTNAAASGAIKKLNTLGTAILIPQMNYETTVAVFVDAYDNIFGVGTNGIISVYDSFGNVLFNFGGKDEVSERLGNLLAPVALSVTPRGRLLVLDKEYNMVVEYAPTQFAGLVYDAIGYYKEGLYLEGEQVWKDVLKLNGSFILSYRALAKANMKRGDYDLALEQFRLAEDKAGYSEAFWQIRNEWLQDNLGWIVLALAVIAAAAAACIIIDKKRKKTFLPIKNGFKKVGSFKLFSHITHMFRFLSPTKTQDAVYEIKHHKAAGVVSAIILYAWFVLLQILDVVVKGYLFSSVSVYSANALKIVLYSTVPIALWVVCNYFVSSVTDGEGKLRHCFIATIYSIAPYLIMALPISILTNLLTFNEEIVYTILMIIMLGWSAVTAFLTIQELHDYTFWQTVKNIFLTLVTIALALLAVIVLRILILQFFGYFGSVIGEVFASVAR